MWTPRWARRSFRLNHQRLSSFHEIPVWQKDNEYLLSGYRPTADCWKSCAKSVLEWHNESVNILSHAFGAVLFAALPIHFFFVFYEHTSNARTIDLIIFSCFFAGVSICFTCSAGCHLLWNHSPEAASLANRIDFRGIIALIWAASLASIHFAFACDIWLRALYWLLISANALGCITFTLDVRFTKPAFRPARAIFFSGFGFFALIFVLHGIYLFGFTVQRLRLSLGKMVSMALFNLLGVVLYALRFPEVWWPYKFDLLGASHQLFHVLVLVASFIHYMGLIEAFLEVRGVHHTCSTL